MSTTETKKRYTAVYPNIEVERIRKGLTQEELSKELGIVRKTYYAYIHRGRIPTAELIKMANFFDCSVDYLLGRTRNPSMNS